MRIQTTMSKDRYPPFSIWRILFLFFEHHFLNAKRPLPITFLWKTEAFYYLWFNSVWGGGTTISFYRVSVPFQIFNHPRGAWCGIFLLHSKAYCLHDVFGHTFPFFLGCYLNHLFVGEGIHPNVKNNYSSRKRVAALQLRREPLARRRHSQS